MNLNIPGDTGFWLEGADGAASQHYTNGQNDASIINGKLYAYKPSFNWQAFAQANPDVPHANAQEIDNSINADAPGNGAGKGSMKEGLLSAAGAAGAFYGAGNLIGGLGGAAAGAGSSGGALPTGGLQLADAGNIMSDVGPGYGAAVNPNAGSLSDWSAAGEASDAAQGAGMLKNAGINYSDVLKFGSPAAAAAASAAASSGATQPPAPVEEMGKPYTGPGAGSAAGAAGSAAALARIMAGNGTPADYLSVLGGAAPGLLGAFASSQQADQFQRLADEYKSYGAPSRARYEASFAPGFTMSSDPGYQDAINQTAKAATNAASMNYGNPGGSPNAWAQTMKDVYSTTAYPALQNYRTLNGNAGGISTFAGAVPATQDKTISADANVYNGIGAAASNVFNPPKTLAEQLQAFKTLSG